MGDSQKGEQISGNLFDRKWVPFSLFFNKKKRVWIARQQAENPKSKKYLPRKGGTHFRTPSIKEPHSRNPVF